MTQRLVIIALIGVLLLSGCSMLGNNEEVAQPTEQPTTTVTTDRVSSMDVGLNTPTATPTTTVKTDVDTVTETPERTGDLITQTPASAPTITDAEHPDTDTPTDTVTETVETDTESETQTEIPTDAGTDEKTEDESPTPEEQPPTDDTDTGDETDTETPDDVGGNETDEGTDEGTETNETDDNGSTTIPDSGTVIRVHDANIIVIETESGNKETVRLIGIDVPETLERNTNPELWGLNDTNDTRAWVSQHGRDARKFTASNVLNEQVRLGVVRRDDDGRLVAQVYVGNTYLNRELLENGYARMYEDDMPFVGSDEYGEAEYFAKENNRGIWGYDQ